MNEEGRKKGKRDEVSAEAEIIVKLPSERKVRLSREQAEKLRQDLNTALGMHEYWVTSPSPSNPDRINCPHIYTDSIGTMPIGQTYCGSDIFTCQTDSTLFRSEVNSVVN